MFVMRCNRLVCLLSLNATVSIGACSTSKTVDTGDGGDAGPVPDVSEPSRDAGVLSETLRSSSDAPICVFPAPQFCKATYDEGVAAACKNSAPGFEPKVATCGEFLVISDGGGFSSLACYYRNTSRNLAAEYFCTDTNSYCAGQSFCAFAGENVGACLSLAQVTFTPANCPPGDAGTSESGL